MLLIGKRGSVEENFFKAIFEVVLFAVFVIAMMGYSFSMVKDDAIVQEYYVRDNALLLDSMHGSQGIAEVNYSLADWDFDLTFSPGKVSSGARWFSYGLDEEMNYFDNETVSLNYLLVRTRKGLEVKG